MGINKENTMNLKNKLDTLFIYSTEFIQITRQTAHLVNFRWIINKNINYFIIFKFIFRQILCKS